MTPPAWCRFCGASLSLYDFRPPATVFCAKCGRESVHVRAEVRDVFDEEAISC